MVEIGETTGSNKRNPAALHKIRVNHAIGLIGRGMDLIREANQQLRNLGTTVSNPISNVPELGRTVDGRGLTKKVKIIKHWNARKGVRNNSKATKPSGRANGRKVRR